MFVGIPLVWLLKEPTNNLVSEGRTLDFWVASIDQNDDGIGGVAVVCGAATGQTVALPPLIDDGINGVAGVSSSFPLGSEKGFKTYHQWILIDTIGDGSRG